MKLRKVKDLMVPLSEYATVSETATLLQAFKAFQAAQASLDQVGHRFRSILVVDRDDRFVGKLSKHDVIEALEPRYAEMRNSMQDKSIHRLGFSGDFVESTLEQYHLWEQALENLCEKAVQISVKNIMYTPGRGEFVKESTTMDSAIHRLIIGHHHSLLVTADHDEHEIVGVLRLTDVFEFVSDVIQKEE
jgi:CBS domain-containing protein